jgi:hypothetical protein
MNRVPEAGEPGGRRDAVDLLRRLAKDEPPEGLAEAIAQALAQTPPPRRSLRTRLARLFERPVAAWGYRLATLGVLLGILAGVWALVAKRAPSPPRPAAPSPAAQLAKMPRSAPPVLTSVTFVFYAPKARSVSLVGSFNDWDPRRTPMTKGKDGNWTVQVTLAQGRYEYLFFVDDLRYETDPDAVELRSDGLGHENAVLRL